MSNFTAHICSFCGADLKIHSDGVYKCTNCGKLYSESRLPFKRAFEAFEEALAEENAEKLARLVRRRYEIVSEKYVSNEELKSICEDILSHYDDDDFYSKFYRCAYTGDKKAMPKFLSRLDVALHMDDADEIIRFILPVLKEEWFTSVGNFIEKIKSFDTEIYHEYQTRFDEQKQRVDDGVFEPTLPRDVFIMYSSADMEKVEELVHTLEGEYDLKCFLAARNLRHGAGAKENYKEAINTAIKNCRTVVFVSSKNSRTRKCEAYDEMVWISEHCPEMPRIEWLVEEYDNRGIESKFKQFFAGKEYCTSDEDVAERVAAYIDGEIAAERSDPQKIGSGRSDIDALLFKADMACANEKYSEACEIYQHIMAEHMDDIRGYIGAVKAQSANYTLLNDSKANNFIKLINKNFGESKAMGSDPDYADYIERISGKDKAAEAEKKAKEAAEAERKAKEAAEAERKAKEATEAERKAKEAAEAERKAKEAAEAEKKAKEAEKTKASTSSISSAAASAKQNNSADFEIVDGVLKKYNGRLGNVTIPDGVTSIDGQVFEDKKTLKNVVIPNGVTSIGRRVFCNCANLENITIPDSLTSIGESAFNGCVGLTSITIPDGVTSIGDAAFSGCTSLVSITIPDSVTNIGDAAFSGCSSLVSIKIPDSVTSIGTYAFYGCKSLTGVTIPNGVTSISEYTFEACTALKDIRLHEGITDIGKYAFRGCAGLNDITIPLSITGIGHDAFDGCTGLNAVYIKDIKKWVSIKFENEAANPLNHANYLYLNGKSVTSLTFPENVKEISKFAFKNCLNLENITIPAGVKGIHGYAFMGCENLKDVTLSEGLEFIHGFAFSNCKGLESIKIPDSVTSIGWASFSGCTSLGSIIIPKNVTGMDVSVFDNCVNLKTIYCGATSKPATWNDHWKGANADVVWGYNAGSKNAAAISADLDLKTVKYGNDTYTGQLKDGTVEEGNWVNGTFQGAKQEAAADVSSSSSDFVIEKGVLKRYKGKAEHIDMLPYGVTSIGEYAFKLCSIKSIIIPDSVTRIDKFAFAGCHNLTRVKIPNSVKCIDSCAFMACTSLVTIVIPSGVTSMGRDIFDSCKRLKTVNCRAKSEPAGWDKKWKGKLFLKVKWDYKGY